MKIFLVFIFYKVMSNCTTRLASLLEKTARLYAVAADKARMADRVAGDTPDSAEAVNALMTAATSYHEARTSAESACDFLDALDALAVAEKVDAQAALAVADAADAQAALAVVEEEEAKKPKLLMTTLLLLGR